MGRNRRKALAQDRAESGPRVRPEYPPRGWISDPVESPDSSRSLWSLVRLSVGRDVALAPSTPNQFLVRATVVPAARFGRANTGPMQPVEDQQPGVDDHRLHPADQPVAAQEKLPVLHPRAVIERAELGSAIRVLRLRLAFAPEMFELAVQPVIDACAEWVQLLPMAGSSRFGHPGGQLLSAMVLAIRALDRRRHQVLPRGAAPEEVGERAHRWTYAVFVAALLRHLPQLTRGLRVVLTLKDGVGRAWCPRNGSMCAMGATSYRTERVAAEEPSEEVLPTVPWLVFEGSVPVRVLEWLAQDPQLMSELRAILDGGSGPTGCLAELVIGGPVATLAEQRAPAGAGDALRTGRSNEARPEQVGRAMGTPEHLEAVEPDLSGAAGQFVAWLRQGVATGALKLNAVGGMVFVVAEGLLLVSPGVFRAYAQQRGTGREGLSDAARRVQRAVLNEGWHLRGEAGVTMLEYQSTQPEGPHVRVNGVVIRHPRRLLPDLAAVPSKLVRMPADCRHLST